MREIKTARLDKHQNFFKQLLSSTVEGRIRQARTTLGFTNSDMSTKTICRLRLHTALAPTWPHSANLAVS